jgi:hypothetical protein
MTDILLPFYVYLHRKASDGTVFYVGKGRENRFKSLKDRNKYWRHTEAKHGFVPEIIARFETDAEAIAYEILTIKAQRQAGAQLVNMTDGGEGHAGYKPTPEALAKRSAAMMGRVVSQETREKIRAGHLGKVVRPETREKLRAANLGKIHSAETRAKVSEAGRGRVVSAKTREKISATNKAFWHTDEAKAAQGARCTAAQARPEVRAKMRMVMERISKPIRCVETGEIFPSMTLAAEWIKVTLNPKASGGNIGLAARGKIKHAYGYHWELVR